MYKSNSARCEKMVSCEGWYHEQTIHHVDDCQAEFRMWGGGVTIDVYSFSLFLLNFFYRNSPLQTG